MGEVKTAGANPRAPSIESIGLGRPTV